MLHRFKESVLQTIGTKKSSYENKEFQQRVEKYNLFIRSLEQVHEAILLYIESYDLMMSANVGLAESLCNFSVDMRKANMKEGASDPMNQVSLHFLKIQEDISRVYEDQIKGLLIKKCLRPLESILSLSALVSEKEKIIKSSTLDCDSFKSRKDNELLSGKLSDHPTVVRLNEQLEDAKRVVESETLAVMNFFDRIDANMSIMLGPETSVLVGSLQHSHTSSAHLLTQLNSTLPTSAATICELSALFEEQKDALKSPRWKEHDSQPITFPAVLSHVQFLNVDIFSPLQQLENGNNAKYERKDKPDKEPSPVVDLCAPEKSGILKKKSKLFWEERWFELRKPGILSWYKNSPGSTSGSSGSKDEARNHLRMCDVISIDYTPPSCNISIDVGGRKSYELFAPGEDLAAEWYAALLPWLGKGSADLISEKVKNIPQKSVSMVERPLDATPPLTRPHSMSEKPNAPPPPPRPNSLQDRTKVAPPIPPRPMPLSRKPNDIPPRPERSSSNTQQDEQNPPSG